MLVDHVLNAFLKHPKEDHDPDTYGWYKGFSDTFKPKYGKLRVTQLKKQHVVAWLKDRNFNPTSQNRAIGALKRAFQLGHSHPPIGSLAACRSQLITLA
jgi:hypothetical protein